MVCGSWVESKPTYNITGGHHPVELQVVNIPNRLPNRLVG